MAEDAEKTSQKVNIDLLAENGPKETNEIEEFMHTWVKRDATVRDALTMMLSHFIVSTISFYLVRDQIKGAKTNELLDSLYFSIVTMTTVGYGDLVPNSVAAKILSSVFVMTGITLVCVFFTTVGDRIVKKQSVLLVKAMQLPRKADGSEILKEVETNRNRVRFRAFVAVVLLILHLIAGTITMTALENLNMVDAIYTVCSTVTTLGYGDKSFSTTGGRIFATVWILTSTLSLGQSFVYIAEDTILQRQRALVKWILSRKMACADLEAADINDDGFVNAAEFAIYKLKEMGKISQEDVSMVIDEFENLEGDQAGTLSVSDLDLKQFHKQ